MLGAQVLAGLIPSIYTVTNFVAEASALQQASV